MAEKNKKNTEGINELDLDQMGDVAGGILEYDRYGAFNSKTRFRAKDEKTGMRSEWTSDINQAAEWDRKLNNKR